MKKTLPTVIYFGNEQIATGTETEAPVLRGLIESGYKVLAVIANHKTPRSRTQKELEVVKLAKLHGIPLLDPANMKLVEDKIKDLKPDVGILIAFGKIIPQNIIDLFPAGIVNLHPSLLPLHRGPTPIESVILKGEQKTGVSIMALGKKMDAGPVYAQSEIGLDGTETKQHLATKLSEIGSAMIIDLLPEIVSGQAVALPQDESRATYDGLISKDDGNIDWGKPAKQIEREVRAYLGWPGSRAKISDKDTIITLAEVAKLIDQPGKIESIDNQLIAYCSRNALKIKILKPAGKKEISAQEFIRGYQL